MQIKKAVLASALAGSCAAQRPSSTSICDYYTTALLMNNTAANQATLLTLVVNTAVIGNYTMPNVGIAVPGILAPGMYNGTKVNLLPYFNGQLASSNRGGSSGVGINFLDGGGAAPLMKNMPANSTTSNQYFLLTHLYQFFGALLGCTMMSGDASSAFPSYQGHASMYDVHKFMDLGPADMGYFITQVGMSAASFGVTTDDVNAVGMALAKLFDYKCSPPTTVIPAQGPQLQAICIQDACPLSPNATCASYAPAVMPMNASSTMSGGASMTSTMSSTGTMTSPTTVATAGAAANGLSLMAVAGGFAALML